MCARIEEVIEPYVAFSNDAILQGATHQERSLEGQTWAPIPMETQVAPIEEPTKELAPAEVSMEEAAPMEEPNEELAAPTAMVSRPAEDPDMPPYATWGERKGGGTP